MVYRFVDLERDTQAILHLNVGVKRNSIGRSVLGRDLYELTLGEGERKVHMNASFHANEWITTIVLLQWFNTLLSRMETGEVRLTDFSLSMVPMVNPDGIELLSQGAKAAEGHYDVNKMNQHRPDFCSWKANIRGVDLNKQFPAHWERYKGSIYCKESHYRDYPGEAALSEPEASAMYFLAKKAKFDRLIALHTQGEEFYWGYGGCEPEEARTLASHFESVSCYKGIRHIDSDAGYRDWFIMAHGKPGFTLELGKGINPLPLSQLKEICNHTFPILDAALFADG
ncbi:MAG: M14 family metallocarboxypeptidase [Bacillus sp. (in: firmicutes)]